MARQAGMWCGAKRWLVAIVICVLAATTAPGQAPKDFDPRALKRFDDGAPYLEKYETGLYPGGKKQMPEAHAKAGVRIAVGIQSLDVDGKPDRDNGRILALVFGHSNPASYFEAFAKQLVMERERLHPRFLMISVAGGGNILQNMARGKSSVWTEGRKRTSNDGLSKKQVQILFLYATYHTAHNKPKAPPRPFPDGMQEMQKDLAKVLEQAVKEYPNLKIAYVTADTYRGFTGFEPHVWQEAFPVKWLIESQIKGEEGTQYEGAGRRLPWLQWGPYLWDNSWDKSYFSDGAHPAPKAQQVFVKKYWDFLATDPVAKSWFWKPGS